VEGGGWQAQGRLTIEAVDVCVLVIHCGGRHCDEGVVVSVLRGAVTWILDDGWQWVVWRGAGRKVRDCVVVVGVWSRRLKSRRGDWRAERSGSGEKEIDGWSELRLPGLRSLPLAGWLPVPYKLQSLTHSQVLRAS